jgi:DNA transformation protein
VTAKAPEEVIRMGPKSRQMLQKVGIESRSQLVKLGSIAVFVKVKRASCNPSLNFLWGLESVITGEHWQDIAKKHHLSLILALEDHEKNA